MQKILNKLGRPEPTITLTLDAWSELRKHITKASSLATVASQHDFNDQKIIETFMWALSDFLRDAEEVMDVVDEVNNNSTPMLPP